eukprot:995042-Ditylum_brightwellii.AAC.1
MVQQKFAQKDTIPLISANYKDLDLIPSALGYYMGLQTEGWKGSTICLHEYITPDAAELHFKIMKDAKSGEEQGGSSPVAETIEDWACGDITA